MERSVTFLSAMVWWLLLSCADANFILMFDSINIFFWVHLACSHACLCSSTPIAQIHCSQFMVNSKLGSWIQIISLKWLNTHPMSIYSKIIDNFTSLRQAGFLLKAPVIRTDYLKDKYVVLLNRKLLFMICQSNEGIVLYSHAGQE